MENEQKAKKPKQKAAKTEQTSKKPKELTPKQERFIDYYLETGNGAKSARLAGFSKDSAAEIAHEYLRKPHILAEVKKRRAKLAQEFEITQKRILKELAAVAFGNINRVMEWDEASGHVRPKLLLTETDAAYIESITIDDGKVTVKTLGNRKVEALEKLGKHLGMWKNEDSGNDDSAGRRDVVGRLSQLLAKRRAKNGGGEA